MSYTRPIVMRHSIPSACSKQENSIRNLRSERTQVEIGELRQGGRMSSRPLLRVFVNRFVDDADTLKMGRKNAL